MAHQLRANDAPYGGGWVVNMHFTMAKNGEGVRTGRRDEVIPPYGQLTKPIMSDGIRSYDYIHINTIKRLVAAIISIHYNIVKQTHRGAVWLRYTEGKLKFQYSDSHILRL
jgi:hypothetical protein